MEFSQAEDFNVPVDLNQHPVYGMVIAYLMDLSTIKARIESGFYRRKEAILFDVNAIQANAEEYNEPDSNIVKRARIVAAVLRRFIEESDCHDPMNIYSDIVNDPEELQRVEGVLLVAATTSSPEGGSRNRRGGSAPRQLATISDRPRRSTRRPRTFGKCLFFYYNFFI